MKQKQTFKLALAFIAVVLMVLPIFALLNGVLTNYLNHSGWYQPIQRYLVPWEAKLVSAAIYPLGIQTRINVKPDDFAFYMLKDNSAYLVDLSWNCLGWQSILLLIISLFAGLRYNFTIISRIECIIFGLFGTLLVNILRMSIIAAGIYYINEIFAMVIHDYVAAFFTLIWLIFFWWFSFSYVLESD